MISRTSDYISNYWNKRSYGYDNEKGHMIHSNKEKDLWINFLKYSIGTKKKIILDVGCGTGFLSILLHSLGHTVIGLDFSIEMLNIAKKNSKNMKIPFIFGNAENTPFINNTFDVVINRHLLWTLENPKKAIMHWKNLLVDNGELIILDGKWNFSDNNIYDRNIMIKLPLYGNINRPDIDINYLIESGFPVDSIITYDPKDYFGENLEDLEIKDYFLLKAINR